MAFVVVSTTWSTPFEVSRCLFTSPLSVTPISQVSVYHPPISDPHLPGVCLPPPYQWPPSPRCLFTTPLSVTPISQVSVYHPPISDPHLPGVCLPAPYQWPPSPRCLFTTPLSVTPISQVSVYHPPISDPHLPAKGRPSVYKHHTGHTSTTTGSISYHTHCRKRNLSRLVPLGYFFSLWDEIWEWSGALLFSAEKN